MVCNNELEKSSDLNINPDFKKMTKNINIRQPTAIDYDANITDEIVLSSAITTNNDFYVTNNDFEVITNDDKVEICDVKEGDEQEKIENNDDKETELIITKEILQKKRILGLKIYNKRNTNETILEAISRYKERKESGLLRHFLVAGIEDD